MDEEELKKMLPPKVFVNGKEYEFIDGHDEYLNKKEYKLKLRNIRIKNILDNGGEGKNNS